MTPEINNSRDRGDLRLVDEEAEFLSPTVAAKPLLTLDSAAHLLLLRALRVLSSWWNFASVGERCSTLSSSYFVFFYLYLPLSIVPCLLSYPHITDVGTDPHTLPCLSVSHLILWLCLFLSVIFLSLSSCPTLSCLLCGSELHLRGANLKKKKNCVFYLLYPAPVFTLFMIKVKEALSVRSPLMILLWSHIWGIWGSFWEQNCLLIMPHFIWMLPLSLAITSTF